MQNNSYNISRGGIRLGTGSGNGSPLFERVEKTEIPRNNFPMSFENKFTADFGKIYPVFVKKVYPGDTWRVSGDVFARQMAMLAPIMHRINASLHFFFVPYRLIFGKDELTGLSSADAFEDFITRGEDGTSTRKEGRCRFTDSIWQSKLDTTLDLDESFNNLKYVYSPDGADTRLRLRDILGNGSLLDFLQVRTSPNGKGNIEAPEVSVSLINGYNLIYNEYYRDQNFEEKIEMLPSFKGNSNYITIGLSKTSSVVTMQKVANQFVLKYQKYDKDYFTSSLPWTQRGDSAKLPFNGNFQIGQKDIKITGAYTHSSDNASPNTGANITLGSSSSPTMFQVSGSGGTDFLDLVNNEAISGTIQNLSSTINDLRLAYAFQRFREASALGGSRYIEQILAHFGVKSDDARLQRPEYLGGSTLQLNISAVEQTGQNTPQDPLGMQAGQGKFFGNAPSFERYFTEHGIIFGMFSITPKPQYTTAIDKNWLMTDFEDWYFPEFAHLGEQAISVRELTGGVNPKNSATYVYSQITTADLDDTFGYAPRYAELKFSFDEVHGEFKDTLDYWHLARNFGVIKPVMSSNFLSPGGQDANRIFPVINDNGNFYVSIYFDAIAKRAMPFYSKPTI